MTGQEQKNEMQDWSHKLVRACAEFVKFKDDLDAANKASYVHSPLIRKLRWFCGFYEPNTKNNYREPTAVMPNDFAENALPFLCTLSKHNGEYYKCLINPQLVVSGTYRNYNQDITGGYTDTNAEDVMNWSDKYVADNAHQVIAYYRPDNLPLYIALEGKNRIELFKRHRKNMLAWVIQTNSVPVSKLKLIRLSPFNVWAVSDSNEMKIIPFPRFTLPVYKALGVDEAKPRWDILSLLKLRKTRLRAVSFQMSS